MDALTKLTSDEIAGVLAQYPEWRLEGECLVRDYTFHNFAQAMEFVNRIAALAEEKDHHPDINIRYKGVRIALISHDVGGLTKRDAAMVRCLAGEIGLARPTHLRLARNFRPRSTVTRDAPTMYGIMKFAHLVL